MPTSCQPDRFSRSEPRACWRGQTRTPASRQARPEIPLTGSDPRRRVCLLPQPDGFAGFGAVGIELDVGDLPAAYGPDRRSGQLDLVCSSLAPSEIKDEHQNPLPAVDDVLDLRPIGCPRRQPVQPRFSETIDSWLGCRLSANPALNTLEVWMDEIGEALQHRSPNIIVAKELGEIHVWSRLK